MKSGAKIWLASSAAAIVLGTSIILNTVFISKYQTLKDGLKEDASLRLTVEAYDIDGGMFHRNEFSNLTPASLYEITKEDPKFEYESSSFGMFLKNLDNKVKNNQYISINSPTHEKCAGKSLENPKRPNSCQVGASDLIISQPEYFIFQIEQL
ncbi:hypothetical protein [Spiroplasma endosymbiont of Panorpa germanica]|uniref:hypothetical protein n=1 Tax=Spiroplasma endosymbiont of Panorpa germanica TaxID=3066314 RepID=UPI0030D36D93